MEAKRIFIKNNKKNNTITTVDNVSIINKRYLDTEYEEMRDVEKKHLEIDNPTYLIPDNQINNNLVEYEEIDNPTYLIPGIHINNTQIDYEVIN